MRHDPRHFSISPDQTTFRADGKGGFFGCAPFVQAVEQGTPFLETIKHPWPNPKTIAALAHLPGADNTTRACCIVTGSGMKEMDYYRKLVPEPVRIPPTLEAVAEAIGKV